MSSRHAALCICALTAFASGIVAAGTAKADIVSSTPTLPVLGAPFNVSGAASCFPPAGGCAELGTLTFTSVVASPPAPPNFNGFGQEIVANATLTGEVTDLSFGPLAPLLLTGTVDMEILERTFSAETGSWTTTLLGLNLEGPFLGHTLTLQLDSSLSSTGTATIEPIVDTGQFLIGSFFDVFAELTVDSQTPGHTTSELQLTLASAPGSTSVPEPASGSLLVGAAWAMAVVRRYRRYFGKCSTWVSAVRPI